MRQTINILLGFGFSIVVAWILWGLGELGHIDLSYSELDTNGKLELWVWRTISIIVGVALFTWVVRKNSKQ